AMGNNHAGVLYPAALPAAPLLVRVACDCEGWVRWAALEILIEFTAFGVDREEFVAPSGAVVHAKTAVLAVIRSLLGDLELIAQQDDSAVPTAQSARELLDCLLEEEQDSGTH